MAGRDRLAEPVVSALGTMTLFCFRQKNIAYGSTRKEVLLGYAAGASSSPAPPRSDCLVAFTPPPHPASSAGSHWAGSSSQCKHLDDAHLSPPRGPSPYQLH